MPSVSLISNIALSYQHALAAIASFMGGPQTHVIGICGVALYVYSVTWNISIAETRLASERFWYKRETLFLAVGILTIVARHNTGLSLKNPDEGY